MKRTSHNRSLSVYNLNSNIRNIDCSNEKNKTVSEDSLKNIY